MYSRLLLADYWDNIADLKVQTLQTPEIWNVEGQRVAKQARGSQGSPDGGQSLAYRGRWSHQVPLTRSLAV